MPASSSTRSRPLQPLAPHVKTRPKPARSQQSAASTEAAKAAGKNARGASVTSKTQPRAGTEAGGSAATSARRDRPSSGKRLSHRPLADRPPANRSKGPANQSQGTVTARKTPPVAAASLPAKAVVKTVAAKPAATQSVGGKATKATARKATPSGTAKNKLGTANERTRKPSVPSGAPGNTARARRTRVPADFAAPYGESARPRKSKSGATAGAATERRTRRDAQARERLRQIMTPDDDLLRRLSRAGAIAASVSNGAADDGHLTKRTAARSVRRPRSWESRCGKCGVATVFKVAAGVCARCGAIALRTMRDER